MENRVSRIIDVQLWDALENFSTTEVQELDEEGNICKVVKTTKTDVYILRRTRGKIVYCRSTDHDFALLSTGWHLVMTSNETFLSQLTSISASSSRLDYITEREWPIAEPDDVEIIFLNDEQTEYSLLLNNSEEIWAALGELRS